MNDAAPLPPVTEERALHIAAFVALIDVTLAQPELVAGTRLLMQLQRTGMAQVWHSSITPNLLRLQMFGVTATSAGTADNLLRNWQAAARLRLSAGVQR
jgi:hypothetical protein